jgi:hypothetical protein
LEALDMPEFSLETHSIMVVLQARGITGPTVNMMAPIVVNAKTRVGAQVITALGSQVPFALRKEMVAAQSTPAAAIHELSAQKEERNDEHTVFAKSA